MFKFLALAAVSAEITILTNDNFEQVVLDSQIPQLVAFFPETCPMCVEVMPQFEAAEAQYGGVMNFGYVGGANNVLLETYQVVDQPRIAIFGKGKGVPVFYEGPMVAADIIEFVTNFKIE